LPMNPPQFTAVFNNFADNGAFPKRFMLFGQPTIRLGAYLKRLQKEFKSSFKRDIIDTPFNKMKKELKEWLHEKQAKFINNIDTIDPDLNDWNQRISTQKENINDLEDRISRLSKTQKRLSELLTFEEKHEKIK